MQQLSLEKYRKHWKRLYTDVKQAVISSFYPPYPNTAAAYETMHCNNINLYACAHSCGVQGWNCYVHVILDRTQTIL